MDVDLNKSQFRERIPGYWIAADTVN